MIKLDIKDLNFTQILINNYKELKLNENQVMILLLIDSLSKEKHSLITGDLLAIKMNLSSQEIEENIVDLMNRGFLTYETENDILVTSLNNTYNKIIDMIVKNEEEDKVIKEEDDFGEVLKTLEEEMKRELSPLEIELVSSWFKDGIKKEIILASIQEAILKHSRLTVKQVDKLIVKNLQHDDIKEEGFTSVDEKSKQDIKKTMDILSYNWVDDDK